MNKNEFIKHFCEINNISEECIEYRMDGRVEWVCEHGVGHPIYSELNRDIDWVHGCDGCCSKLKYT